MNVNWEKSFGVMVFAFIGWLIISPVFALMVAFDVHTWLVSFFATWAYGALAAFIGFRVLQGDDE